MLPVLSRKRQDIDGITAMHTFTVTTRDRNEMVEITDLVRGAVNASGTKEGLCVVYCPHTTAAITVNENADPDVVHDLLLWYGRVVPKDQPEFRHGEGNSDSHFKATLVGPSVTLLISGGRPVLGRWQGVFFCEFDGPRSRTVHVQVAGAAG
jgi:secondary thiamine-phosphate synthase enzyme